MEFKVKGEGRIEFFFLIFPLIPNGMDGCEKKSCVRLWHYLNISNFIGNMENMLPSKRL